MSISTIDIIFIALIVIFTVRCAIKGFVSELLSMAAIVLGLLAALFFYTKGGDFIRGKIMPDVKIIPEVLGFIALFLIVFIVVKIIEKLLKDIIEGIKLTTVDRVIGILFGIIEGVVVVSLVLFIITIQPVFDSQKLLENSFFAKMIVPFITSRGGAYPVI